jgi:membrane-associated phospholipid phosphatase
MHLASALALAVALVLIPTDSRADDDYRLVWRWRRFDRTDFIYTTAAWTSFASVVLLTETPQRARWEGGVLFDDAVRDVLVLRTARGRAIAGILSDFFWIGMNAHVWAESLIVPVALDRGNSDVAVQLTAINFEAFGPVTLASHLTRVLTARARPSTAPCAADPTYEPYCGKRSFSSFPSGHTATAFVAAALSCAHHRYLPLYGGRFADDFACGTVLTMASAAGILRILADRHYASDVLVGAALGFAVGYAVPRLLHYDMPDEPASAPPAPRVASPIGVAYGGTF